jgi:asparagine synthetase B (glutamine-hydrolysing)
MCGIAGFAGFDNHRLLEAMMDTLVHRGPDDEGFYNDGTHSAGTPSTDPL